MPEKEGMLGGILDGLFGKKKAGDCCNMEVVEESEKKSSCCNMEIVEEPEETKGCCDAQKHEK